MIDRGLSRGVINLRINRIKRFFKWATSEELVPPSVYEGLRTVAGLKKGRTQARETDPVQPVSDEHVDAVLPHVAPPVAVMIQVQRLTGMRPCEVVMMTGGDLDTSRDIWVYAPAEHKNSWRGHDRRIPIGPKAQELIKPFLKEDPSAFLFSPKEAMQWQSEVRRAARKTPLTPSQRARKPKRLAHIQHLTQEQQASELQALGRQFRFGLRPERLVWCIHQGVIRQRSSKVEIPEEWICRCVWPQARPKHWKSELRGMLHSLCILHIDSAGQPSCFGDTTSLLTHFKVRQRGEPSSCPARCRLKNNSNHGHVLITLGRGFLGCLEGLADSSENLVRSYQFPDLLDNKKVRQTKERKLKAIGKQGNLTTIYLPAVLGDPSAIQALSHRQHRLLQAIFRERERVSEKHGESIADTPITEGAMVPPVVANRKGHEAPPIRCALLDENVRYCGFNGNRLRKGRGYRILGHDKRVLRPAFRKILNFPLALKTACAVNRNQFKQQSRNVDGGQQSWQTWTRASVTRLNPNA